MRSRGRSLVSRKKSRLFAVAIVPVRGIGSIREKSLSRGIGTRSLRMLFPASFPRRLGNGAIRRYFPT